MEISELESIAGQGINVGCINIRPIATELRESGVIQ
jgi:hypothetical protein